MYDQNVLDIYTPSPDRVTEFGLGLSNDWDFDQSSINMSYDGSLRFFRDFPEKSYHYHALSLTSNYRFEHEIDDDEDSTDEQSGSEPMDSAQKASAAAARAAIAAAGQDSLEQTLYGSLIAASQFDRSENSTFDNSIFGGSISFRQPFGPTVGVRPTYTLTYHEYPNLSGITNFQNDVGVLIGLNVMPDSWVGILPLYSVKTYPTKGSVSYTIATRVLIPPQGHGRGATWRDTTISGNVAYTVPSVSQFAYSAYWVQKFSPNFAAALQYTYFAKPNGLARVLPDVLRNGVHGQGTAVDFASQDDIVDDRFSYRAHHFALSVNSKLPLSLALSFNGSYDSKFYTYAAKDLDEVTVLANQRRDRRIDLIVSMSRRWHITESSSLKPQIEYRYLNNQSNAPYYNFDKNLFLAGIEFNF